MKQNWSVSRRKERRGRKMAKHITTSGRDQVGARCAQGLKPLLGWTGRGSSTLSESKLSTVLLRRINITPQKLPKPSCFLHESLI